MVELVGSCFRQCGCRLSLSLSSLWKGAQVLCQFLYVIAKC